MRYKVGSHVGIVLSFVIFIVFLVFLYSVFEPTVKVEKEKRFALDYLETKLIEKVKTDFASLTITIEEGVSENCVVLDELVIEDNEINSRIIVKDESGEIPISYILSSDSSDLIIQRGSSSDTFFKIYSSDEFDVLSSDAGSGCQISDYDINMWKTERYVSEKEIIELKNRHLNEYEVLKTELEVAKGNEFGFHFIYSNGTEIATKDENVLRGIFVEDVPVQYIDENLNILSGIVKIKIW